MILGNVRSIPEQRVIGFSWVLQAPADLPNIMLGLLSVRNVNMFL